MTCIIASRRWICADRRLADDDGSSSSIVKVAKNPWLIAAASGLGTAVLAVKRAVRDGAESPADLLKVIDSNSYALVLSWDGILSLLSEGMIWPAKLPIAGIGSGSDLAIGFMHGAGSTAPAVARAAQRFVAKRRTDCGDGCDLRTFCI